MKMRSLLTSITVASTIALAASGAFAASSATATTPAAPATMTKPATAMKATTPAKTAMKTKATAPAAKKIMDATGMVKSITDKTLTLADGTKYVLPHGFDIKPFKKGTKVTVAYEKVGKKFDATKVTAVN
jgi:hypothetical protein